MLYKIEYYFGIKNDRLNQMIVAYKVRDEPDVRMTLFMNGCDFHGRMNFRDAKKECMRRKLDQKDWKWIESSDVKHMLDVNNKDPMFTNRSERVRLAVGSIAALGVVAFMARHMFRRGA